MKYLENTKREPNYALSIFRTVEPYERRAGLDICEFQTENLQKILDSHFGSRKRTSATAVSFLRSYVRWCRKQGYKTEDGAFHIEVRMEDKVRRLMIASPKHLQTILDKTFAPVDSRRIDCIYRCFLWLLFSGMDEAGAIMVTVDEINFNEMTIEHQDQTFELYREAVPAFRMACEAAEFVYKHPLYEDIIRKRYEGQYLMRGFRSNKITLNTAKGVIGKAFRENGIETSLGRIRLSGIFYRAYETERFGEEVNFDGAVKERIAKVAHTSGEDASRTILFSHIKRDLLNDYACWKEAFAK